ncbi:MAG: DUF1700 domain-containing protein [Lachnospiraceae bacterium]|nr:DUF1700 domain-containing protein [Lachnospiraceae bacterium]
MTRQEFLEKLRAALNGRIPAASVNENVNYYEDYIITEVRKGRIEEDVLKELGDPRLIAKTIITAGGRESGAYAEDYVYGENTYDEGEKKISSGWDIVRRLPSWLVILIVAIVVISILVLAFSVLSVFAPFILVMLGVIFLVRILRDMNS